jgi:hypothetical protein
MTVAVIRVGTAAGGADEQRSGADEQTGGAAKQTSDAEVSELP